MPERDTSGIGERIPRELIEGDFNVAFSFVDMATNEARQGHSEAALQLLESAERLLDGLRDRLLRMTAAQKQPFEPRCAELDEAIKRALSDASGSETESDI